MVGYGPEDSNFVLELTYNYGIGSYQLGNDFGGIWVTGSSAIPEKAKSNGIPVKHSLEMDNCQIVRDPDGHKFHVLTDDQTSFKGGMVVEVQINASDLSRSVDYWQRLCGMSLYNSSEQTALLGYNEHQCKLKLQASRKPINRGTAFGRIAFSCPEKELLQLEEKMKAENQTIQTPLVTLDTPGKASVQVIILADPNGHEICFVGDESFRELSKVDPNADSLLRTAMENDSSLEWFAKSGGKPSG